MPRYFFDIRTPSGTLCSDTQGLECSDAVAALREAQHGAQFVTLDECARNPMLSGYEFRVADEAHQPLFTLPFSELQPCEDLPSAPVAPVKGQSHSPRQKTSSGPI
jgi:hypothetical protein